MKSGENLVTFEEALFNQKSGVWVNFVRKPTLEGEELAKAKKKLKGDQLKMLNPIELIGFLPLNELRKLDAKEVQIRSKLTEKPQPAEHVAQVAPTTTTTIPDTLPMDYDFDNTYIKLKIELNRSFHPEISDYQMKLIDLLPKQPPPKKVSKKELARAAFKSQLQSLLPLIAKEYLACYGHDINEEVTKAGQRIPLDNNASLRRSMEFLSSVQGSYAYNKIKEEILPTIRTLVKHSLNSDTDIVGVSREQSDGVFSKIFELLSELGKESISILADNTKDIIGEKVIISPEYSRDKTYSYVQKITGDDKKARFTKLSVEYEKYGKIDMAINRLKVLIEEGHNDILKRYVDIELKNRNLNVVEEYLLQLLSQGDTSFKVHFRLLGVYLAKGMYRKALITSKTMEDKWPGNLEITLIRHYLYKTYFEMPDISVKYYDMAKRIKKRDIGVLQKYNPQGRIS